MARKHLKGKNASLPEVDENESKSRFAQDLQRWLQDIANYSSIHGLVWYERSTNPYFKAFMMLVYLMILILLPTVIGLELRNLLVDPEIGTAISRGESLNETYPIITLCHPGFFDSQKLAGKL